MTKLKTYWIKPYSAITSLYAVNSKFMITEVLGKGECSFGLPLIMPSVHTVQVFSQDLDPNRNWYALSTDLCCAPPNKFCQTDVFKLFPDEVSSCLLRNLRDKDGGLISAKLFNSGVKAVAEKVYVGTYFALIAGNLRRRSLNESNFLKSEEFLAVKKTINQASFIPPKSHSPSIPSSKPCSSTPIKGCSSDDSLPMPESPSNSSESFTNGSFAKDEKSAPKLSPLLWSSSSSSSSSNSAISFQEIEEHDYEPQYKKRKIRDKCTNIIKEIHKICHENGEELNSVLARCCVFARGKLPGESRKVIRDVILEVEETLGLEKTLEEILPTEILEKQVKNMSVPDWQLLLLKLQVPISDEGWQTLLNVTELGKNGRSSRAQVLLSKNSIKAIKSLVFSKIEDLFLVEPTGDEDIPGYQVALEPVVCWQARELRLHGHKSQHIQLNLKLDGRPFGGRNQVLVGVIPASTVHWSNHSSKSFFPLAIANCKEERKTLRSLIAKLNNEKDAIKRNGITVDGKVYNVSFRVTLDLKALYLLLVKDDDEDFKLGGKGLDVEFCFICQAMRNCNCDLGPNTVCLQHFSETKANIGSASFRGIRDDLIFLLEEELSSINLCVLHCELRNTEHLIASLGLQCYRIGTLKQCNKALSNFGPETTGDRITLKLKEGQQTAVTKQNITVKSFSGNTERRILDNIEDILEDCLPQDAIKRQFDNPIVAKEFLLNKISFCSQQVKYYTGLKTKDTFVRDFGKYQEEIALSTSDAGKKVEEYLCMWKEKEKDISEKLPKLMSVSRRKKSVGSIKYVNRLNDYAAQIFLELFLKVFTGWREIAKVMRKEVYGKDKQDSIDVYDLQCKEWGFLLREMFGSSLGTGDYGHMTIEHSSMLLRQFGSLREYSQQSIESAHSLQRQLYAKATSHDRHGYTSSIKQIILHFYSERLLFLRLCFRKALECNLKGAPFHFGGCGWPLNYARKVVWSSADVSWIQEMDTLLTSIFGEDFLQYKCDRFTKVMEIAPESLPTFVYDHEARENNGSDDLPGSTQSSQSLPVSTQSSRTPPVSTQSSQSPPVSTQSSQSPPVSQSSQSPPVSQSSQSPPVIKLGSQVTPSVTRVIQSKPKKNQLSTNSIPNTLYPDLRLVTKNTLSRRQISQLQLPPVVMLSHLDLEVIKSPVRLSNPMLVAARPPQGILNECKELLHIQNHVKTSAILIDSDDDDDDDTDIGIQVGGLGVFNRFTLDIWEKAFEASNTSKEVHQELNWLAKSNGILTSHEAKSIEALLLDSKPDGQILSVRGHIVDVKDLTTLVGERYLTGFVIDGACLKYKELSRHGENSLFLPTFCQDWTSGDDAEHLKNKVMQYTCKTQEDMAKIHWVMMPLHLAGSHWGLLVINIKLKLMYYDDGLHWKPPSNLGCITKKLIQSLYDISDGMNSQFDPSAWDFSLTISHFGMPSQPAGSGSCGMGVIMSVDSIVNGPLKTLPDFSWKFDDMHNHRCLLLKQFLEWKTQDCSSQDEL